MIAYQKYDVYHVCVFARAIKEDMKQPTVLDTVVMWYIKLLASTAEAALPVAPQLKRSLIAHSRYVPSNPLDSISCVLGLQ